MFITKYQTFDVWWCVLRIRPSRAPVGKEPYGLSRTCLHWKIRYAHYITFFCHYNQVTKRTEVKTLRPRTRLNFPAAFSSYFTTRSSGWSFSLHTIIQWSCKINHLIWLWNRKKKRRENLNTHTAWKRRSQFSGTPAHKYVAIFVNVFGFGWSWLTW